MANDDGLVDEFERIQKLKSEIELKEKEIKIKIIELAKEKNTDILFGTNKKCSVKEYEKIIYPEDKENFVNLIKNKGLYDKFSSLNYFKLAPAVRKKELDSEILDLIKKERDFRISLKDK
ncbi:hypothetical protein BMS3Abin17_01056 [archaeon BMS3Abin17]|nr:hypothetical protein BMS3Abin17_01056 [archaeon BMS3Abin17]HDZ60740.1 hypothetical protein [Candidatus Pacearchaeota archaeon]